MADHMVIKLGQYLRVLGYDTAWDRSVRTHELITRANRESRIFVTRNHRLPAEYPLADRAFVVEGDEPVAQFREVVHAFHLDCRKYLFSRCIRCNVLLEKVPDKQRIQTQVHPRVFERHAAFFTCPSCRTVFWHGSHVRNTCAKLCVPEPAER